MGCSERSIERVTLVLAPIGYYPMDGKVREDGGRVALAPAARSSPKVRAALSVRRNKKKKKKRTMSVGSTFDVSDDDDDDKAGSVGMGGSSGGSSDGSSDGSGNETKSEKFYFYRHQVAGHYPILWKKGAICKPIMKNELKFYQQIEASVPKLLPFVPRFLGVVTMDFDDLPRWPASPSRRANNGRPKQSQTAEFNRFNQWGLRCHMKKKKDMAKRPRIRYIRLEDLTLPFCRPNILDLKIGTRVYGVDDDPRKIRRKMEKSARTTSSSLGLRLCGLQVYDASAAHYVFRDKFYGRNLGAKEFPAMVESFFTSGGRLRVDVIKRVIRRVLELQAVVSKQRTFQFFSSSLLFVYEGCDPQDQRELQGYVKNPDPGRADFRMIDFAQAAQDTEKKGVHSGFLFGLQNLVKILRDLCDEQSTQSSVGAASTLGTSPPVTQPEETPTTTTMTTTTKPSTAQSTTAPQIDSTTGREPLGCASSSNTP